MIDGIMKEERGVALRLLYQLKMSLEKVYPPTDVSVLKKSKYLISSLFTPEWRSLFLNNLKLVFHIQIYLIYSWQDW
jgi:phosphatidylglycerophosphatase A